jgi:hypothetical protein
MIKGLNQQFEHELKKMKKIDDRLEALKNSFITALIKPDLLHIKSDPVAPIISVSAPFSDVQSR